MLETPVTVSYATSLAEVALNPADSSPADPLHKTHAFDDLDESVAPSARLRELVRQTNYQNMFHKIMPGQRKGAGSAAAAAVADDDAKVKTHAYVCLEQQRGDPLRVASQRYVEQLLCGVAAAAQLVQVREARQRQRLRLARR